MRPVEEKKERENGGWVGEGEREREGEKESDERIGENDGERETETETERDGAREAAGEVGRGKKTHRECSLDQKHNFRDVIGGRACANVFR